MVGEEKGLNVVALEAGRPLGGIGAHEQGRETPAP